MAVFELSLDALRTYQGRNPRPTDFDDFWATALAELSEVTEDVQLSPVEHPTPVAECFDLTFTGVRGARIYAKYLRPTSSVRPHPGVVVFHGYSGSSPDWFELIPYAAQGFSIMALDCRGQGGRSEDPGGVRGTTLSGQIVRGLGDSPANLAFRQIFLDGVQVTRLLMDRPEVDASRVAVTGASQGGGLTLAVAALEPSVRLAAATYPFLSDYLRTWEMDLATDAYAELREYLRRFDPTHANVDNIFQTLGYIDVQHLAPRIKAKVLMTTGLMDTVCPPSTQFAAYNKISAPKDMVIYPDYEHEPYPGRDDRILSFFAANL